MNSWGPLSRVLFVLQLVSYKSVRWQMGAFLVVKTRPALCSHTAGTVQNALCSFPVTSRRCELLAAPRVSAERALQCLRSALGYRSGGAESLCRQRNTCEMCCWTVLKGEVWESILQTQEVAKAPRGAAGLAGGVGAGPWRAPGPGQSLPGPGSRGCGRSLPSGCGPGRKQDGLMEAEMCVTLVLLRAHSMAISDHRYHRALR